MKVINFFFRMGNEDYGITPGHSSPNGKEPPANGFEKSGCSIFNALCQAIFDALVLVDRCHNNSFQRGRTRPLPILILYP